MIARYLVVNRHGQPHGGMLMAPPSPLYLETINSNDVGGYIKRDQPYRVVKLIEDPDFIFSEDE